MSKRANPMAVKSALTYEIGEAAIALGKTPATIRNWIRDGLPVLSSKKPYLISGAAIREYLREKYKAAKSPLGPNELFCLTCRTGRAPLDLVVTLSHISSKTSLLKGACSHCGGTSTRMISRAKPPECADTFNIRESVGSEP